MAKSTKDTSEPSTQSYYTANFFSDIYPWQQQVWQQLTLVFPNIAHGLLFSGAAGIGKRHFAYAFAAWLVCENTHSTMPMDQHQANPLACGRCASCLLLKAGNHPDIYCLPRFDSKKKHFVDIGVDDIRELQPFVHQTSHKNRVLILNDCENMSLGAANALLKTLEEPASQVYLLLITDSPSKLLPTISSRLQQVPINQITHTQGLAYVTTQLPQRQDHHQLLAIAGGAPLKAVDLAQQVWYEKRDLWLKTWQALRTGQRSVETASDYWQKQFGILPAIELTQLMLLTLYQYQQNMPLLQNDLDLTQLNPLPCLQQLDEVTKKLTQMQQNLDQNVQEKLSYDNLLGLLSQC